MSKELNEDSAKKMKVHVISNTHWDRAWVYPFHGDTIITHRIYG